MALELNTSGYVSRNMPFPSNWPRKPKNEEFQWSQAQMPIIPLRSAAISNDYLMTSKISEQKKAGIHYY